MTLRVGLLGAGRVAELHAAALDASERARLVAIGDPDLAAGRALARRHDVEVVVEDPLAVLDLVDAVIVAAPTGLHHRLTLATIDAGRHALVEKPFTTDVAEARSLAERARQARVQVVPAQVLRFLPQVGRLLSMTSEGRLGTIINVVERRLTWRSEPFGWWRDSPDLLIGHWGSHSIDLVTTLVEDPPARVYCTGGAYRQDLGFVDDCTVDVVLHGGTRFTSHLSFVARTDVHDIVVIGSDGTAELHGYAELVVDGVSTLTGDPEKLLEAAFRGQLDAFVDAVETGTPTVSIASVLPSLVAIEAAERSLRTGTVVVLDEGVA